MHQVVQIIDMDGLGKQHVSFTSIPVIIATGTYMFASHCDVQMPNV